MIFVPGNFTFMKDWLDTNNLLLGHNLSSSSRKMRSAMIFVSGTYSSKNNWLFILQHRPSPNRPPQATVPGWTFREMLWDFHLGKMNPGSIFLFTVIVIVNINLSRKARIFFQI